MANDWYSPYSIPFGSILLTEPQVTWNGTSSYITYGELVADNPKFDKLLQQMADLHEKKNHDYADENPYSNFEGAAAIVGCDVDTIFRALIGIKLERLRVLLSSGKTPNNESVQDSRMDLTMYCALWTSYHLEEDNKSHAVGSPNMPPIIESF